MKLRWKMLLQLGLTSFLLMVAILLFTVDYTTAILQDIRAEGKKYALADLQVRAKASVTQLKNQITSFYARVESLRVMKNYPFDEAHAFIRKRIVTAEETDTVLFGHYTLKNGKPELTEHFAIRMEEKDITEDLDLGHILAHNDFNEYLMDQSSPEDRPKLLLINGDPGEIWVMYKTKVSRKKDGMICVVRFSQDYLINGTSHNPSEYLVYCNDIPVFGSTRCLKNPLPGSIHDEISKLIAEMDLEKNPFVSRIVKHAETETSWFITGVVIKTDENEPVIKMVRVYDYNVVTPYFTQLLNDKIRHIRFFVFAAIIVGLVLLAIPLFVLSRQLSHPLSNAADFADQLAKGDFTPTQWNTKTGIKEVDRMLKALSYMRDQLNSSIGKLKRSHSREIEARTDAENANRLKSDFLDAVSKEYKDPLDALTGFAVLLNKQIAEGQPTNTKEFKSILDAISENLTRLTSMGNLLNKLSYLNLREEDLHPAECDLFQIFHEINAPAARLSRELDTVMEFRYSNSIPYTVYTDRERMMQMLNMTVHTLCISTPKKASIFFDGDKKNEMLVMSGKSSVSNPALIEYKQYLNSKESLRSFKHIQEIIQFTIVKHLIGILGGMLDIIIHPQGGYQFMITFAISDLQAPAVVHGITDLGISIPSSAAQPRPIERNSIAEIFAKLHKNKAEGSSPVCVLLGVDDGSHKLLLEIMLRGAGCEVRSAESPEQCREKMMEKMPDIFLLDLRMQSTERGTFVTDIRKMPGAAELFIFPLAANWEEKEKIRLISAGADECLTKPLDMDVLTKAVQDSFLIRGNIERTH